ncbi:alpha-glucosidase [Elysia marginata]|uniref:Alpha-glucosidase n=1 Tax=Elysia marginata TaxID=1093978 RepID=A0AAV4GYP1_9GAST|nr:alpha-glucosidase [Elysia marginata]
MSPPHTIDDKAYDDSVPIAVQAQESKRRKRRILKVSVYCMFGIIAMGVFVIWLFHKDSKESLRFGNLFLFTVKLRRLEVKNVHGEGVLYGDMGRRLLATPYDHCWHDDYKDYEENCLQWFDTAKLHVEQYFPRNDSNRGSCYSLRWVGLSEKFVAEDCFYLQRFRWYGVLTDKTPVWPIESVHLEDLTEYYDEYPSVQNENLVPIWYGSQGVTIFVDSGFPFTVSWNVTKKRQFCISTMLTYDPDRPTRDLLRYHVCQADSIKEVYQVAQKHRKDLDTDFPAHGEKHELLRLPIHALSKYSDLEELVEQINKNESSCSLFEIYDNWENESYGDLDVNQQLLSKLSKLDMVDNSSCRPILPISTFFSYSSELFQEGVRHGFFVRDQQNLVTRLILWREREGAVLDVTNPDAAEWFLGHVRRLKTQLNVKAFKMLHLNIPPDSSYHDLNMTHLDYTRIFHRDLGTLEGVSLVLERATGFIPLPVYTPIRTRFYGKSGSKCLNTSVPYTLIMGLSGYPLLIADADLMTNPTTAMFMRWLQLAVFFPVLEIPNLPLLKNKTMQNFLREILDLRMSELLPHLEKIWRKEPTLPILRPLLWEWPDDVHAQAVGDQFMVGDSLLVAPVLCEDTTVRSVYLPEGTWVGYRNTNEIHSPGQYYKFSVEDFTVIPFFWRLN